MVSIENLKKLKYPALVLSIICSKRKNKNGKKNKDEEWIEILKILGLIENVEWV